MTLITALRSILFNILFYGVWTPLVCLCMAPCLLFPRPFTVWVADFYQRGTYLLERFVLGLDYEIRGIENRPPHGQPYIAAAKHYSAYETLKLYRLFKDPTVVLKRELLWIPVFGWFLKKLDVIAIDRGNRESAMASLIAGAQRMRDDNRPIVIFPQGTRVPVDAATRQKPYKGGIVKLYVATSLPIVPVAMNSGLYWPRNAFWKKPGKVVFEFLPPIPPGLAPAEVMAALEERIETASNRLVEEGRQAIAVKEGKTG
ncbi:MAG: lysophospholipid acyltransferase family protein [Micavibrio sp.]